MYKKIICIVLILLYIFCIVTPSIAHADFILDDDLLNGLFWSVSRQIGISGENIDSASEGSTLESVGLTDVVEDYKSWFGLSEVQAIWDDIKNDITDLGTVQYSNGREVPSMKLEVKNSNVNSIKQFSYSVQEYWKQRNTLSSVSNNDWISINELFGGYLTYGSQFNSIEVKNKNFYWRTSSLSDYNAYDFFTLGMDLYQHADIDGTYYHLLHFDESNGTVTLLKDAVTGSGQSKTIQDNQVYLIYVQSVNLSSSASIIMSLPNNGKTNTSGRIAQWYRISLLNSEQYDTFISGYNLLNSLNNNPGVINITANQTSTNTIIPGGQYYLVSALNLKMPTKNSSYNITNDIVLTVNNNPYYVRNRLFGVNRGTTWNVDITDSGTGTPTTLENALYTYFPSIYDYESESPYIYFPSSIATVPELTDVLTTDYAITGDIANVANPESQWPEGVTINTQPPGSLGLGSIWHYVQETYDYVSTWIGQIITIWAYAVPPIIRSAAYSFVVIGIIFGIYRRLIE